MKLIFDKASKYFFWISGAATALGTIPIMVSPGNGLELVTGVKYFDESPQLFPVVGHWSFMVVAVGVLLFLAATNKQIRKLTAIFGTIEKIYIVGIVAYCFFTGAPYAKNYSIVLIGDGLMAIGGIWYLLRSRELGRP